MNVIHSTQFSPSSSPPPPQNRLLSLAWNKVNSGLFARLNLVELSKETVLYEPHSEMNYAYFPINSIISIRYEMKNGETSEICVVGNDGMLGAAMILGAESTPNYAVVLIAGLAYRLSRSDLAAEMDRNREMRNVLLRYAQSFTTQLAQSAVCNSHHYIEQRLCRFLLQSLDRLDSNRLPLTQEIIARMLGVQCEGVMESASKLQNMGAISCSLGDIHVLDREILESLCCECYELLKIEENRLFPVLSSLTNKTFPVMRISTS